MYLCTQDIYLGFALNLLEAKTNFEYFFLLFICIFYIQVILLSFCVQNKNCSELRGLSEVSTQNWLSIAIKKVIFVQSSKFEFFLKGRKKKLNELILKKMKKLRKTKKYFWSLNKLHDIDTFTKLFELYFYDKYWGSYLVFHFDLHLFLPRTPMDLLPKINSNTNLTCNSFRSIFYSFSHCNANNLFVHIKWCPTLITL